MIYEDDKMVVLVSKSNTEFIYSKKVHMIGEKNPRNKDPYLMMNWAVNKILIFNIYIYIK